MEAEKKVLQIGLQKKLERMPTRLKETINETVVFS